MLRDVFEIKIIIAKQGQSTIAFRLDFLNYRRACSQHEYATDTRTCGDTYQRILLPDPATSPDRQKESTKAMDL